ncbi:MAG TPA: carboxylesterase family protein [Candidatus Limnocylindrales bacterium]|nr:carboxylesterase family protein [Candidatus Limnocylindrales bacterium]
MKRFVSRQTAAAALILSAAFGLPALASAQTLIATADGNVQGQVTDGAREFLGIPYAAPPVGPLRFKPPQDPTPWVVTLDATAYPPACSQLPTLTNNNTRIENEDCLYLNVWTPNPAPTTPLPVMFWIHGGSNTSGSTGDPVPFPGHTGQFYDGHRMARDNNVIVVSVNYRLNVFGFFGLTEIAAEDPGYPYAGNQGLLDQRKGMQWVHDNIAAFGGDPANVTIYGESAGSFDVCAHVVSAGSQPLFQKAISESGGCTVGVNTNQESIDQADVIADAVGCGDAEDRLACLRGVSTGDLLDAGPLVALVGEGTNLAISVDGGFLTDLPINLFDDAVEDTTLIPRKPYILGSNTDEGTLFFVNSPELTPEEYTAELISRFDTDAAAVEAMYPASNYDSPRDALIHVFGDAALVCSTYDTAKRYSRIKANKARTFVYNFDRKPPLGLIDSLNLGVFHGIEIGFVFNSIDDFGATDKILSASVQQYWSSLATTGKPKNAGRFKWPKFKEKSWKMLRLDAPLAQLSEYKKAECEFWSSRYEAGTL